jgi:hypothetical protein
MKITIIAFFAAMIHLAKKSISDYKEIKKLSDDLEGNNE